MPIKIVKAAATPEYDLRGVALGLGRKTGVLIRHSKKGADLESRESRLRQELLVPVAIALRGEPDGSNVILTTRGPESAGPKAMMSARSSHGCTSASPNRRLGTSALTLANAFFRSKP